MSDIEYYNLYMSTYYIIIINYSNIIYIYIKMYVIICINMIKYGHIIYNCQYIISVLSNLLYNYVNYIIFECYN